MNLWKCMCVISLICLIASQTNNRTVNPSLQGIIEISPTAMDVMVHAFDNVVVYFHSEKSQLELKAQIQDYEWAKDIIKEDYPKDHTLFGHVNVSADTNNLLKRYGKESGFLVVNKFIEPEQLVFRTGLVSLIQKYQEVAHPKIPLGYKQQVLKSSVFKFNILFTFQNMNTLKDYQTIYEKVKFYLDQMELGVFAAPIGKKQTPSIKLYRFNEEIEHYNFTNMTVEEKAIQLVQQLNIDTLPSVTKLSEDNLHRIFGGQVSEQLILLSNKRFTIEEKARIEKVFEKAADINKYQQLNSERVIFCQTDEQFFEEQFNEESINIFKDTGKDQASFAFIFTKTDYDRFNLKKYILNQADKQLTAQDLIQFIDDVRMRRLEPQYKSEKTPDEKDNVGVLRKIVGSNFISQVYERQGESVIVLFIDSKDEDSYKEVKNVVEEFAAKYKDNFRGRLTFGIFDLAKNEHKMLYLKQAPQLVLFDRANKKQLKRFKLAEGISIQALQQWVTQEVTNASIEKVEALL